MSGAEVAAPIFIGGLTRSGTPLMRAIIGSHPAIAFFPADLPFWREFYVRYAGEDLRDAIVRSRLVDQILSHRRAARGGMAFDRDAILEALEAQLDTAGER